MRLIAHVINLLVSIMNSKGSVYRSSDIRANRLGLSLREFVYEFKHQTLILFKCALLQPKVLLPDYSITLIWHVGKSQMLFFGSSCERLCMTQFSLLSLIPGLLRNLEDCGDPDMNTYESKLKKPTSVKTSDRKSCLYSPLDRYSSVWSNRSYSIDFYGITAPNIWERKLVWALHTTAAARCSGRFWHKVICCRIN